MTRVRQPTRPLALHPPKYWLSTLRVAPRLIALKDGKILSTEARPVREPEDLASPTSGALA
jgi:hypothetical protein